VPASSPSARAGRTVDVRSRPSIFDGGFTRPLGVPRVLIADEVLDPTSARRTGAQGRPAELTECRVRP
jgi:hypothetical protein